MKPRGNAIRSATHKKVGRKGGREGRARGRGKRGRRWEAGRGGMDDKSVHCVVKGNISPFF